MNPNRICVALLLATNTLASPVLAESRRSVERVRAEIGDRIGRLREQRVQLEELESLRQRARKSGRSELAAEITATLKRALDDVERDVDEVKALIEKKQGLVSDSRPIPHVVRGGGFAPLAPRAPEVDPRVNMADDTRAVYEMTSAIVEDAIDGYKEVTGEKAIRDPTTATREFVAGVMEESRKIAAGDEAAMERAEAAAPYIDALVARSRALNFGDRVRNSVRQQNIARGYDSSAIRLERSAYENRDHKEAKRQLDQAGEYRKAAEQLRRGR